MRDSERPSGNLQQLGTLFLVAERGEQVEIVMLVEFGDEFRKSRLFGMGTPPPRKKSRKAQPLLPPGTIYAKAMTRVP